jgi:hypothetical protein
MSLTFSLLDKQSKFSAAAAAAENLQLKIA